MKKWAPKIIFLLIVGALIFVNYEKIKTYADRWINFSFCDKTVLYKVGEVDPRFGVTREQAVNDTIQAAGLWNDIANRELFKLDPDADLEINLIYDERQKGIEEINLQKTEIEEQKIELEMDAQTFQLKKAEIETKLNELNKEIAQWNRKGGAPPDVYDDLKARQEAIQKEIDNLNATVGILNNSTDKINTKVEELNDSVNNFNKLLTVKPEEGIYMGGSNRIEIYIYDENKSFVHTVAHELGHALGLDHVDQKESILYPISSPESHATESDINALNAFCENQNRLELIKNDFKNYLMILYAQLQNVIT